MYTVVVTCVCVQMVRAGEGLQCASDGLAGTQPGGPLQLLWPQIHHENSAYAR